MDNYSERLNRMSFSQTFVMSNKVREMKAKGIDVISLTLGEPDFDVPKNIKEAAFDAINTNFSHYSPVPGFLDLREAICEKLKKDNHIDYLPSQICVSNGAKQSILNVLCSIINEGDEVILPAPFWVSYDEMVKMVGGKSVFIETSIETDFKMTAEQLEKAITPKTKALLYSSPCNPSGSFYKYEELEQIANVIAKYPQITIISDEIYEYINYDGKHTSIAEYLAAANPAQVEDIIHPLGFYRSKTQHLIGLATALDERFGGVVPRTMDELTSLPGVGRKTANVVLGNAFDIPGFPVDTHVMRVTGRLRWRSDWRSAHPDPVKIEKEITSCFPPEEWTNLSHRLILFGRATCHARTPDCANCPLSDTCPSYAPPAGKSTSKR